MTDLTSAKSRLIRPGVVIRSVMPWTPESSTWSALRNASSIETPRSLIDSSRSLGMTMRVSTSSRRLRDAGLGLVGATAALEGERAGHDTDRQGAQALGDPGDDGRAAGAGAAALAGGDEDHVGPLEDLLDLLRVVLGGLLADLGVGAGAEPTGELTADVELDVGVAHQQRLRVGVDRDELDALEADLDHPVDGVDTAAADADDLDDGEVVLGCCHDAAFHWVSLTSAAIAADEVGRCAGVLHRNPQHEVDSHGLVTVRWDDARSAREVRQRGRGRVAASLGEILPCEWTTASLAPPVSPVTRRQDGQRVTGVSGALTSTTFALVRSSTVRMATLRAESSPPPQTTVR